MVSCLRRKTEQQRLGKEEMERNYYVCFALIVTFSVIRTTICCHLFLIIFPACALSLLSFKLNVTVLT